METDYVMADIERYYGSLTNFYEEQRSLGFHRPENYGENDFDDIYPLDYQTYRANKTPRRRFTLASLFGLKRAS